MTLLLLLLLLLQQLLMNDPWRIQYFIPPRIWWDAHDGQRVTQKSYLESHTELVLLVDGWRAN